ncbi:MAG: Na/Pi cotransporter family protein [Oscillospiraceae bacterium]|nr:Na/Pi cotransporter family protein [Oscillospiraceae bacterium]
MNEVFISILKLCGGLAFFLYGMNIMSSGLEKAAGSKLEVLLKKMTSNPFKSLLLGAGITIAIQSSSAMTVMLVGLVNSGIMTLRQTIGVIMGSNIGTTLTAWLLSMTGIDSDNIFINLLNPKQFSLILALIGILFIMMSKSDKKKNLGAIFIGFTILIYGMDMMGQAVDPLKGNEKFAEVLTMFNNPVLGVLVGAVVTGVIQSSAASVGMLQTLAMNGGITYGMAIPIIMGQNIGTCVTALLSSIGVSRSAKKVSVVHISFNLIGTIICLVLLYSINAFVGFTFMNADIDGFGIALVHSIFNISTTLMLLPFTKLLEKIANIVIKDTEGHEKFSFVDERLIATPSIAIAECNNKSIEMAQIAHDTLIDAIKLSENYDTDLRESILANEDLLDNYEDKLGTYLVKLSAKSLSAEDSHQVAKQLHTIDDFERIGDHAVNILKTADEMYEKKINFSEGANRELRILKDAITEILDITTKAFVEHDIELAKKVEPLEQVIDVLISEIKSKHIIRLQAGNCTIELGFILSDTLNNYERVSDHCSNIAVALIESDHDAYDVHSYLKEVKTSGNVQFEECYRDYSQKYRIQV